MSDSGRHHSQKHSSRVETAFDRVSRQNNTRDTSRVETPFDRVSRLRQNTTQQPQSTNQFNQFLNRYEQSGLDSMQQLLQFTAETEQSGNQLLQHLLQQASQTQSTYAPPTLPYQSFNPTDASYNTSRPTPFPSAAPPPPPGPTVPAPPPPPITLLPQETLHHIPTRVSSARVRLGRTAVLEARKGLSRILDATSTDDIHQFAEQLRRSDPTAVEQDWQNEDRLPIFPVSYVQRNPPVGRFKFDNQQWQCFVSIVQQLAESGVTKFRVWLDQCLWLRDASQGGWAHTGLLPYIMWPVISLGTKKVGGEKSVETETRMWPFLEEVAGLWGMGVIFSREMRSKDATAGWRKWMSYCHRLRLEPEEGMKLLLINVFHGAADDLQTGWQDDVRELQEMARANVLMEGSELYIGSDWKQRLTRSNATMKPGYKAIQDLALSVKNAYLGGANVFVDASRTVMSRSWNGIREWLSGHEGVAVGNYDMQIVGMGMTKVQVISDIGEFELLKFGEVTKALWLMVAMDGPTSNFSRGKVAWTKIMTGLGSCELMGGGLMGGTVNAVAVGQVLEAELQRSVAVRSVSVTDKAIEWE